MTNETEPYENTISIDELHRTTREYWQQRHALTMAIKSVPEVPPRPVLWMLAEASMNWHGSEDVMVLGKALQRKHGLDAVPPKTELECAAGLWTLIRRGLLSVGETVRDGDKNG